jgi:subtilisin family serine protease
VEQAVSMLQNDPDVEYAEPNYIYHASALVPDDTFYDLLWGLNNTGQSGGVANVDIDAPEAWAVTTGSSDVVVGIIDTGIDYLHPDLAANIWTNPGEIPDNGIDDDGNGFVDDVHGWNAENGTGDPFDDNDHGTHVAGTIGAVSNNGEGVTGINWNVRLMSLKFLDAKGSGYVSDAVDCINYAIEMKNRGVNIRVLNASWGGAGSSNSLQSAIKAAGDAGILFVAAAGNNGDGTQSHGADNDSSPNFPSSYNLANIISVAAIDRRGQLPSFSNYGAGSVDLGAPGVSIASTIPSDEYALFSGTSMAAPHVSGVAALLVSAKPDISLAVLKSAILKGAVPLNSLKNKTLTGGMLNAFNALQHVDDEPPPSGDFRLAFTTVKPTLRAGESGDFGLLIRSSDGFSGPVTLSATLNPDPSGVTPSWSSNPVEVPANGRASTTLTLTLSSASTPGSYQLIIEGVSDHLRQRVSLSISIEPAMPDPKPSEPGDLSGLTIEVAPAWRSVTSGGWAAFRVDLNRTHDVSDPVNLEVLARGDDPGLSGWRIVPNPAKGRHAIIILSISPSAPRRAETWFIRGTGSDGTVVDSNDFVLNIR